MGKRFSLRSLCEFAVKITEEYSDRDLLRIIATPKSSDVLVNRDIAASSLIHRYSDRLASFIRKSKSASVDDVLQETFVRMSTNADTILDQMENRPLIAWLLVTARRIIIDQWRNRESSIGFNSACECIEGIVDGIPEPHQGGGSELAVEVRRVISMLPPNHSRRLWLVHVLDMKKGEAGRKMGEGQATFSKLYGRAVTAFAKQWLLEEDRKNSQN
jgi:DNA-directed RNA polymerase specialized sigma24 family protein